MQRAYYLDCVKVLAAVLVVFIHTASAMWHDYSATWGWQIRSALSSLSFCAVPLSFMVSGCLLFFSPSGGDIRILLRRRIPRLLVPLVFWLCFAIVFKGILVGNLSWANFGWRLLDSLQMPTECHLWYLYAFIAVYAITPVVGAGFRCLSGAGRCFVLALVVLMQLQRRLPNGVLIVGVVLCLTACIGATSHVSASALVTDGRYLNRQLGLEPLLAAGVFLLFRQNHDKPFAERLVQPVIAAGPGVCPAHIFVICALGRFLKKDGGIVRVSAFAALVFAAIHMLVNAATSFRLIDYLVTDNDFANARQRSWRGLSDGVKLGQ